MGYIRQYIRSMMLLCQRFSAQSPSSRVFQLFGEVLSRDVLSEPVSTEFFKEILPSSFPFSSDKNAMSIREMRFSISDSVLNRLSLPNRLSLFDD